jgi:hypothetical protein
MARVRLAIWVGVLCAATSGCDGDDSPREGVPSVERVASIGESTGAAVLTSSHPYDADTTAADLPIWTRWCEPWPDGRPLISPTMHEHVAVARYDGPLDIPALVATDETAWPTDLPEDGTAFLTGTLTDWDGSVVRVPQKVSVRWSERDEERASAVSDADGRFSVRVLAPLDWWVGVETPGRSAAGTRIHVERGETRDVSIKLTLPAMLRVEVNGGDGPLHRATVTYPRRSLSDEETTDGNGVAICWNIGDHIDTCVSVACAGYLPQEVWFNAHEITAGLLRVTLRRGIAVHARFIDESGKPHPGVEFVVSQPPPRKGQRYSRYGSEGTYSGGPLPVEPWSAASVASDADGRVIIGGLPKPDAEMRFTWTAPSGTSGDGTMLPGESVEISVDTGAVKRLGRNDAR